MKDKVSILGCEFEECSNVEIYTDFDEMHGDARTDFSISIKETDLNNKALKGLMMNDAFQVKMRQRNSMTIYIVNIESVRYLIYFFQKSRDA